MADNNANGCRNGDLRHSKSVEVNP